MALVARIPPQAGTQSYAVESVRREYGNGRCRERPYARVWRIGGNTGIFGRSCWAKPEMAVELGAIGYSSSVTVILGYDQTVRVRSCPLALILVPRSEGRRILATTFVSINPATSTRNVAPDPLLSWRHSGRTVLQSSEDEIRSMVYRELKRYWRLVRNRCSREFTNGLVQWPSTMLVTTPERLASGISSVRCPVSRWLGMLIAELVCPTVCARGQKQWERFWATLAIAKGSPG